MPLRKGILVDNHVNSDGIIIMPLVTLKDVAREVGLSVSCVARALKGRSDIPATTCKRVQEAAERLGYRPNPMLTALAAYRQTRLPANFHGETLAFVANKGDERSCLSSSECGDLFRGSRKRAESLGYRLEYFNIGDDPDSHKRAARTLAARGIRGLLLATFPLDIDDLHLSFEDFHSISLFGKPHSDRLTCISSYHAQSMELVLQKLQQQGIRHPALILNNSVSRSFHLGWLMAYKIHGDQFRKTSTHLLDDTPADAARLREWIAAISKEHPANQEEPVPIDALIYGFSENKIPTIHPEGAGFLKLAITLSMDLINPKCGISGIYQNRLGAGAMAVEWLHNTLMNYRVDIERGSTTLLIPGRWMDASNQESSGWPTK